MKTRHKITFITTLFLLCVMFFTTKTALANDDCDTSWLTYEEETGLCKIKSCTSDSDCNSDNKAVCDQEKKYCRPTNPFLAATLLQAINNTFNPPENNTGSSQNHVGDNDGITFIPQVTIPGSEFRKNEEVTMSESIAPIAEYLKAIYNYLLAIVGIVAVIVLMIAGIIWLTSGGNSGKISQAKNWMMGSITGLVLMLSSYLILRTINPYLVDFRITPIKSIDHAEPGCCKLQNYADESGILTGKVGTSMTFNATAAECYEAALKISEPGIKKMEELSDEEKKDIEGYMTKKGKFFKGQKSFGFTKCEAEGYCLYHQFKDIDRDSNTFDRGEQEVEIRCFLGIKSSCTGYISEKRLVGRMHKKVDEGGEFFTLNKFLSCDDAMEEYFSSKILSLSPSKIPVIEPNLKVKYKKIPDRDVKDGDLCDYAGGLYYYYGSCYYGSGKLGEPCGDDKGLCVPTGTYCGDIPGFEGREWKGGRICGDKLKCCY